MISSVLWLSSTIHPCHLPMWKNYLCLQSFTISMSSYFNASQQPHIQAKCVEWLVFVWDITNNNLFNLQPWSSILFITKLTMNSYEHLACIDFTYCYLLLGEFYDGGNADQKGEYFWLFMLLIPHSFPFLVCFFTSSLHFRDSEANAWFARGTGCWNKWWSSKIRGTIIAHASLIGVVEF